MTMSIKQFLWLIGIVWLNRSESLPLLNDRSSPRARIHLLDHILTSNARGWNLNASAINDCHEKILLLIQTRLRSQPQFVNEVRRRYVCLFVLLGWKRYIILSW